MRYRGGEAACETLAPALNEVECDADGARSRNRAVIGPRAAKMRFASANRSFESACHSAVQSHFVGALPASTMSAQQGFREIRFRGEVRQCSCACTSWPECTVDYRGGIAGFCGKPRRLQDSCAAAFVTRWVLQDALAALAGACRPKSSSKPSSATNVAIVWRAT